MRFQCSVSLPSRGAFHRSLAVLCAIGRHRYLALEGGPPRFPRATSCPVVLAHPSPRGAGFRLRGSHPLWRAVPGPSSSQAPLRWARGSGPRTGRTTPAPQRLPACARRGFGLLPVRSPLLGECSLLLGVLRCFSSPTYLRSAYGFSRGWRGITPAGLPHSGIDGALPACGPPSLFAACHALHRPVSPRHPPHTGSCLRTTVLAARQNSDHVPRDLVHRSLFNCQGAAPCGAPIIIAVGQTHGKAYTPSQKADSRLSHDAIAGA